MLPGVAFKWLLTKAEQGLVCVHERIRSDDDEPMDKQGGQMVEATQHREQTCSNVALVVPTRDIPPKQSCAEQRLVTQAWLSIPKQLFFLRLFKLNHETRMEETALRVELEKTTLGLMDEEKPKHQQQFDSIQTELASLQDGLAQHVATARQDLSDMEKKLDEELKLRVELEKTLGIMDEEHQKQLDSLQTELASLQEDLSQQVATARQDLRDMEKKLDEEERLRMELEGNFQGLKDQMQQEHDDLSHKLTKTEGDASELQKSLEQLHHSHADSQQEYKLLEEKLAGTQSDLRILKDNQEAKQTEFSEAIYREGEENFARLEEAKEDFTTLCSSLRQDLNTLRNDYERDRDDGCANLRDVGHDLDDLRQTFKEHHDKTVESTAATKNEIAALRSTIEALQQQLRQQAEGKTAGQQQNACEEAPPTVENKNPREENTPKNDPLEGSASSVADPFPAVRQMEEEVRDDVLNPSTGGAEGAASPASAAARQAAADETAQPELGKRCDRKPTAPAKNSSSAHATTPGSGHVDLTSPRASRAAPKATSSAGTDRSVSQIKIDVEVQSPFAVAPEGTFKYPEAREQHEQILDSLRQLRRSTFDGADERRVLLKSIELRAHTDKAHGEEEKLIRREVWDWWQKWKADNYHWYIFGQTSGLETTVMS